ncbi:uncharacterized protein EI97DRAFT_162670 [Westerdykella ornata]|uniref:Uncharacterized protein n=1 Tax=Westerdykella ornata TaxID=318751 RepID=A0A6A6JD93_WESOR|nr:uncharacterized protein EI97DRAFT_162670 [Westerdykella ornata]KAF2273169.1 hypothetical protein EI97DRAFT_162670 [Westerdykella ornata]
MLLPLERLRQPGQTLLWSLLTPTSIPSLKPSQAPTTRDSTPTPHPHVRGTPESALPDRGEAA